MYAVEANEIVYKYDTKAEAIEAFKTFFADPETLVLRNPYNWETWEQVTDKEIFE